MLSHVRHEHFLVITLLAVENKRSGAAEVAGIASTRLANTPNQGKRCTALRRHTSRGFLSLGKGTVRLFHILICLSAISALERSREFTAAAAEAVTKKWLTSSIESLTSVDASEFLTSSIPVWPYRAGALSLDHVDQEECSWGTTDPTNPTNPTLPYIPSSYKPYPTLHTLGGPKVCEIPFTSKRRHDTCLFQKRRRKRKPRRKESKEIFIFVVSANFVGKKKFVPQKNTQLISRHLVQKPEMRPVPVLSDYLVKIVIPASRAI